MNIATLPTTQADIRAALADVANIGDMIEGGYLHGILRVGDAIYGEVSAPKAHELTGMQWLSSYADVPGANSTFDGLANTTAMAAAGSLLAAAVLDLRIGGYGGWYVPARDGVERQYFSLKPTNEENCCSYRDGDNPSSVPPGLLYTPTSPQRTEVSAFIAGAAEAFEPGWYWSSTQYGRGLAYVQHFGYGYTNYDFKGSTHPRCRPVRRFLIK